MTADGKDAFHSVREADAESHRPGTAGPDQVDELGWRRARRRREGHQRGAGLL